MAFHESTPANDPYNEQIVRLLVASNDARTFGPAVTSVLEFVVISGESLVPDGYLMSIDDLELSYEMVMAKLSQSMEPKLQGSFARTAAQTLDTMRQSADDVQEPDSVGQQSKIYANRDLLITALYNRFEDFLVPAVFEDDDRRALEEILSQEVSAQLTIDSEIERLETSPPSPGEIDIVGEAMIYYKDIMRSVERRLQDRSIEARRKIAYYASQAENELRTRSERRALDDITDIARSGYIDIAVAQIEREFSGSRGLAVKLKQVLNDFVITDTIKLIERGGEDDFATAMHNINDNTPDEAARTLTIQALETTIFDRAKVLMARGRTQEARQLIGICLEDTQATSLEALNLIVLESAIQQIRDGQHFEVVKNYVRENAYGSDIEYLLASVDTEYSYQNPEA